MKKTILVLVILISVVGLIAVPMSGCKSEEAAAEETVTEEEVAAEETVTEEEVEETKEPVTFEYWVYGGSEVHMEWLNKWTDIWNAENPDLQVIPSVQDWGTAFEHFQTAISTNSMPDMVKTQQPFVYAFGEKGGYFVPIDDLPGFEETKDLYVEGYMETCKSGGKYWGFPSNSFSFALTGNKAMFDEAGLELPKTWSEFRETAKALTKDIDGDGKIDQYGTGIMGADPGSTAYRLIEWAYKAGGAVLNEDWTGTELNEAPWIEAVKLFQGLLEDGSLDPAFLADDFVSIGDKFANGIVAMDIEGYFWEGYVDGLGLGTEMIYGIVPVPDNGPYGPHTPGTLGDGTIISITTECEDIPGAFEYLKFMSDPAKDLDCLEMGAHNGLPLTKEVAASDAAEAIAGWEAWEAEGPTVKGWPYHQSIVEISRDVIAQNFLRALSGELTAEEAMARADAETVEILNR